MPQPRLLPLLAALAALGASAATAETSPYYVGVAQSLSRDSNLLRVGDGDATPDGRSRSDTISETSLVAGVDQPIGRQHLQGSAVVSATRFSENEDFDGTTYLADLGLDWETVHRLSGVLKVAAARTLRQDVRTRTSQTLSEANYENSRRLDFVARLGVVTPLTFEVGAGARRIDYSAEAMSFRDYRERYGRAGLRWRAGGSTTLGLGVRRTESEYPSLLPDANPEDERRRDAVDLTARWTPTGSSTFDARVSRARTRHDRFDFRDFTTTSGELAWKWNPGGRSRVDLRLARDEGQDTDIFSSVNSRTTDSLSVRIDHELTGKVDLNARLVAFRRSLEARLVGTEVAEGEDSGNQIVLGLRWQALRSMSVGCEATRERRSENDVARLSSAYRATVYGCDASFVLR